MSKTAACNKKVKVIITWDFKLPLSHNVTSFPGIICSFLFAYGIPKPILVI